MKGKKLKVAFVIYNEKQAVSFIDSSLMENLKVKFDLSLITTNPKIVKTRKDNEFKLLSPIPSLVRKFEIFCQCVALWKFKERTMTHKVRAMSQFGNRKQRAKWKGVIVYEMENWGELKRGIVRFAAISPFYFILRKLQLISRLILFPYWSNFLQQFDLVIVPFGGHTSFEYPNLIWMTRRLKKVSFAIQENWDNVSSKTFIFDEPDYFGVWGEQSKSHLIEIHELTNTKIRIIGSPRFDGYFKNNDESPIAISDRTGEKNLTKIPYILLAGTGDGIDDELLIETIVKSCNRINENFKIVYRPHPFTRHQHDFKLLVEKFPTLILDEGIEARKFGHQIPLVKHAEMIVSQASTLILEGLLCNKSVCVPTFIGIKANIGYDRLVDGYQHYIGFKLMNNFYAPKTEHDLEKTILRCLNQKNNSSNLNLDWICQNSKYETEITNVINEISK